MRTVIVDYDIGNIQSILNAVTQFKNIDVILSNNRKEIQSADSLILPGVGAFRHGMNELSRRGLPNILSEYVNSGKPILGVCLGMQLLFESSEEFGFREGLGFIKGTVKKFPNTLKERLPHVGWNEVSFRNNNPLLNNIDGKIEMYFSHSYICHPEDANVATSVTEHGGVEFISTVKKDNIYGCQFHPEISAHQGLKVLENFFNI